MKRLSLRKKSRQITHTWYRGKILIAELLNMFIVFERTSNIVVVFVKFTQISNLSKNILINTIPIKKKF